MFLSKKFLGPITEVNYRVQRWGPGIVFWMPSSMILTIQLQWELAQLLLISNQISNLLISVIYYEYLRWLFWWLKITFKLCLPGVKIVNQKNDEIHPNALFSMLYKTIDYFSPFNRLKFSGKNNNLSFQKITVLPQIRTVIWGIFYLKMGEEIEIIADEISLSAF